jgi:carbonic anhydrase/acetyltransferase-like protein (isoleucine patch superfamily)
VHSVEFEGRRPVIHPGAFIASTATLIGDVTVEDGASIWFGAVLRGDTCAIRIREGANVQDNSVLHADGTQLEVGPYTTIGHGCIVHCASVGPNSVIGNGSILLNDAVVGAGSVVAAGSVVTPGASIPDGVLAVGSPARVRGPVEPGSTAERLVNNNANAYVRLAQRYGDSTREHISE